MSNEVIFDKSYLNEDKSMKSFDLTDSIISGITSNSSRLEDSDKSIPSSNKSDLIESNFTNNESESIESSFSNNESLSLDDKAEPIDSIKEKSETNSLSFDSKYSKYSKLSNDEVETNNSNFTTDESISSDSKSTYNKTPNKKLTKKSSSYRSRSSDKSNRFHSSNILPSRADPFIYDRKNKQIRYNFERCVSTESTVIFGGNDGKFVFDPVNKTSISGVNNELHKAYNSSIINCSGVKLKNCKETIALGIKATPEDEFPEDLNQTVLVRNLHVASNLSATNIKQNSVYVEGIKGRDVYHQIVKGDGVDIIYANPLDGVIWIQLGLPNDTSFESNRTIVIKDVTLETNQSTSYNVNIIVPPANDGIPQTKIEYYNGKLLAVSSDSLAGYILNTAGGSVTYRYVESFMPGKNATWVIQNQFIGNNRSAPFPSTSEETRSKLIRKY